MADANPAVMKMVESELTKNPDISNPELFEQAKEIDASIGELSPRQFNATYPLQVKRAIAPKKAPRKRKPRAKKASERPVPTQDRGRDRVRTVLLELARDVANAQGKGDVVDVIVGIDGYVDRVVKAAT